MYLFSCVTSLLSASPLCVQRETGGKVNKQNESKSQYQNMPIQQRQPNTIYFQSTHNTDANRTHVKTNKLGKLPTA
jgi:hypothetical protein